MCTVLLPSGDNPIAVNKYVISYYFVFGLRSEWYCDHWIFSLMDMNPI